MATPVAGGDELLETLWGERIRQRSNATSPIAEGTGSLGIEIHPHIQQVEKTNPTSTSFRNPAIRRLVGPDNTSRK